MSVLNLNKVILAGHLTRDPELKQTPSGIAVTSSSIAINRRVQPKGENGTQGQQQADFIEIVAWRGTAEFISKYFRKGSAICITGALQTRVWTDQNGQKRYATEVVVDEASFVDARGESAASSGTVDAPAPAYTQQPPADVKFEELKSDDDLPF